MSDLINQHYLLTEQYNNAQKLEARIQLHQRFSTNTYDWQRWVFDHLTNPPESRILELGCGPADLWRKNADRIPENWHITLSDFSPGMLQEARQYLQGTTQDFSFQHIDAQSIPFEDAHFDAVIANHMLYHVPDRAKALAEIRRVLKPGGRFYAATNFKLENGEAELAIHFSHVHLHPYDNALVVTEVQPFSGIYPNMDLPSLISGSCFVEGSFTHPSCDGSASASLSTGVSPFPRNSR